jgi:sugar/nucleoside kinase (ribokinase family)
VKPISEIPEFLSVGHVTHDQVDGGGTQPGGAALYSSLTAHRLGKRAAVLTSCGEDFVAQGALEQIAVKVVRASETSTFRNTYHEEGRVQYVYAAAASLSAGDLPSSWKEAPLVYLCPVLHEVPMDIGESFTGSLIGVAPQGWTRRWDESGRIRSRRWEGFEALLGRSKIVIVSEEDIAEEQGLVEAFRKHARIVIVTRAERGATIFEGKRTLTLGACPAEERDPTGAGDCFGAAFLIRYAERGDIEEAGRFASCVGACVVEKGGIAGIPIRQAVEERMREATVPCKWTTG